LTYEQLYADLLVEMNALHAAYQDPLTRIEKGFLVAWRYRNRLPLREVIGTPVSYFKNWLPRFEAEVKYHELCYYAEKFGPDGPLHDRQNFLLRELGRKGRTVEEAKDLFDYIQRGATDRDQALFGGDPEEAAEHVERIAYFIALDRYEQYLQVQFDQFFNPLSHDLSHPPG
jgi:hypothetical protein